MSVPSRRAAPAVLADAGDGLVEDYADYARGEAAAISTDVREVTGVEPRDMATFAKDYARAFVGA